MGSDLCNYDLYFGMRMNVNCRLPFSELRSPTEPQAQPLLDVVVVPNTRYMLSMIAQQACAA